MSVISISHCMHVTDRLIRWREHMVSWCVTWTSTPIVSITWPAVEMTAVSSSGTLATALSHSRCSQITHTGESFFFLFIVAVDQYE